MKIRHFGLPARPLLGGADAAPGAAGDATVRGGTQLSKTADVLVQGGALSFPRGARELTAKARTERARLLLEILRADDGGGFGGKVKGGVDVAASLKSYFRSLEVAQLAADKGGGEAVEAFVAALDLPDDIRPLVALAVEGRHTPQPLGKNRAHENDGSTNVMWQRWTQGDKSVLTVSDDTVRKWFDVWGASREISGFMNYGDAEFKLGVVRFFARAKELGVQVDGRNYAGYVGHLPQTADAARTLLRFASAFQLDPKSIALGGKPLSQWGSVAPPRVQGSPVGREARFKDKPAEWQQAIARGELAATKLDDATVRSLATPGYLADPHSLVYNAPAAVKEGLVLLIARARELGLPNIPTDIGTLTNVGNHIPGSAGAAKAIQRYGRACGIDVSALNVGGKPLHEWLGVKVAVPRAAGGSAAGRPLGSVATWEHEGNYNGVYNVSQAQPAQARTITDGTLAKWFGAWGPNKEITAYYSTGNPESRVTYALWWARGRELGLQAQCTPGSMQQFVSSMPASADAAAALRRLGRAFGFPVEQLLLAGNTPVSTFPQRAGADAGEPASLPKRAALGDTRLTAAQIEKAVENLDEKLFAVDDASLKRLVEAQPDFTTLMTKSADRTWQLGVLDVAERGVALGVVPPEQVQAAIRAVSARNLDDDGIAARLATLASRAGLQAASVPLSNGFMLGVHASTKAHVDKLDRVLQGASAAIEPRRPASLGEPGGLASAEPLGNLPGPHSLYWAHDARMFQIGDDGIRNEMIGWGDFSWLSNWNNNPGVISLIARIAELNVAQGNAASAAANSTRAWLSNPVPEIFGTEDALPRVLRAARAAGVDPATVRVLRGGQPVPLLEHPVLTALLNGSAADQAVRASALEEDLALLADKSAHPAQREGAVLRLLSVTDPDNEIIHQLHELLPPALNALGAGELTRVDLTKVPAKHKDKLLETAFARDEHPGVIALVASVFFKVDAAALERLLLKKGHLPAVAAELSKTGAQLMEKSAAQIAYAGIGLSKDPPELGSLAWRMWLLEEPTPAQIATRLRKPETDAHALCVALLEHAVVAAPARRDAILLAVQRAIDDELVGKDAVIADLNDEVKARLDATAIERAEAAVAAWLEAAPADAPAARAALAAVLGTATWLDDPNIVARAALDHALAHDLKHVAPLAEVDEAEGGVVGKPWQSRLAGGGATVAVGGINVPVEGKPAVGKAGELGLAIAEAGSGKKNLQALATRWLARRPVSVTGADAALAIAALVRATGAKVIDVTVGPATTAAELLGPAGAVAQALATGAVAHLQLDGAHWPDGLGPALMSGAGKARIVASGPALPGFAAITFAPLDEPSVVAHLAALGLAEDTDAAQNLAAVFVALRDAARADSLGALKEESLTLALLDRVVTRLSFGGAEPDADTAQATLHGALVDVFARRVTGDARAAVLEIIEGIVAAPAGAGDPLLALDGKTALIDTLKLAVLGTPAALSSLPALTSSEHAELRAAAHALELGEPVVADASIAERVGTLYGALTGRDVHVHLLHAGSTPEDVIGQGVKDVVVVVHDFGAAPAATQDALWTAAAEGRLKLVCGDTDGSLSADAVVLREDAGSADDAAERLSLHARALGLPDAVAEGVLSFASALDALASSGEVTPLVELGNAQDLKGALELCAQLAGAMPTSDAFVAAMSACWPMSTPAQQERVEAEARRIADA